MVTDVHSLGGLKMTDNEEEVTIIEMEPQKVMGMRRTGEYQEISKTLPALYE